MWLNKYGKRYCNEAFGGPLLSGCAVAHASRADMAYIIWDSDWQERVLQPAGRPPCPQGMGRRERRPANRQATWRRPQRHRRRGRRHVSGKFLYCADTLEELCDWMGMEDRASKTNTLAAVEAWNAALRGRRATTKFGRDPETHVAHRAGVPSTASPCSKRMRRRIARGHVGPARSPSRPAGAGPGLRAHQGPVSPRGNCCGGRFPMGYNGIMNGVSIGMCLTLGMHAGRVPGHRPTSTPPPPWARTTRLPRRSTAAAWAAPAALVRATALRPARGRPRARPLPRARRPRRKARGRPRWPSSATPENAARRCAGAYGP